MTVPRRFNWLACFIVVAFLLDACSPAAQTTIATFVAQTVVAQNTENAKSTSTTTPLDTPTPLASLTPITTKAPPTAPAPVGNIKACYNATFVADVSIPDGTIVSPGATFWKTWRVKNDGSCTWNSTYKFVFLDGDLMGGGYVYPFPGVAGPGQSVDIPIQLYAPKENGDYTGRWMIQAPDKTLFGVGQYSVPLTVKVVVGSGTPANSKTQTVYDVTNVVYHVERRCTSANTFWHITAAMSSNGPLTATFDWEQSDGNSDRNKKVEFDSATTVTVDDGEWSQANKSYPNKVWQVRIIVTSPYYHEFPWSEPFDLCYGG